MKKQISKDAGKIVGLALLFLLGPAQRAVLADSCPPQKWTAAEQFVIDQVETGAPAEFEVTAKEEDRLLSNCFITQLLTNEGDQFRIHPNGVIIVNAIFPEAIELRGQQINYEVKLTNCTFRGKVDFTESTFAMSLIVAKSNFEGPVDFEDVTVGVNFATSGCHFLSATKTFLKSIKVGGDWWMPDAEFSTDADFSQADIKGNLIAQAVTFRRDADFDSVRTKNDCSLRNVTFGGHASFNEAQFANLFLTDSVFVRSQDANDDVDFTGLTVSSCYLDRADFGDARIKIDRMTFQYLSPASWDKLQRLARDQHNSEFYSTLEAMLGSHGYPDQAKQAFFAQREAERSDLLRRNRWQDDKLGWINARMWWIVDELRERLVGYGKSLQLLLLWSVLLFLPGYFIFRREEGMKTKKPEDKDLYAHKYNPFWYALDLFLPIISLGDADIWIPKDKRRWALQYRRIHIIIGNLLLPIGLAAWTGIIR